MKDIDLKDDKISNLIYDINNKQVILDTDLALLYGVDLADITEAVEHNRERFPKRFSWVLSDAEHAKLKSKVTDLKPDHRQQNPRVFTEQGVAILTTILKTDVATKVSLGIMDAFVTMSKYVSEELIEKSLRDDAQMKRNTSDIKLLKNAFKKLFAKRRANEIYFEGQIYDAYSKISEIFKSAEKSLIVVDSYADITILDIVRRMENIQVDLITKQNSLLTRQDIRKYNRQYHNVKVYYDSSFHDRYFIIDRKEVYHCGASVNKIGYKTFSITLISDQEICRMLLKKIDKIIATAEN